MKKQYRNIIVNTTSKPTLADICYVENNQPKPIVIFIHGFKGFKDWGHFNIIHNQLAEQNFIAVKFNFSFNGGTLSQPIDFPDLEAFGNNTYSKELHDLRAIVNWICNTNHYIPEKEKNNQAVYLIGHSRGGGIAILKAAQDPRIKKLVTWAAVSNFATRFPQGKALKEWKEKGVYYITNGRTKQQMPLYYSFYQDFVDNRDKLDIPKAEKSLKIPHLIIHGQNDEAVSIQEAEYLHQLNPESKLEIIPDTGHTFNASHPFIAEKLPDAAQKVMDKTIKFLKN